MSSFISLSSQLLQRQSHLFSDKHILISGDVSDHYPHQLAENAKSVSCFVYNYQQYKNLKEYSSVSNSINVLFGASFEMEQFHQLKESLSEGTFDTLLIYWSKTKSEMSFLLAMLLPYVNINSTIIIVGENNSGVRSATRLFEPYGTLNKYDSARRCGLYVGMIDKDASLVDGITQKVKPFNIHDWVIKTQLNIDDKNLIIYSLPGVFSHGEVDPATLQLLDNLLVNKKWSQVKYKLQSKELRVLDFGCGAGVIGALLLAHDNDLKLSFCDVNAFALLSTYYTLLNNKLLTQEDLNSALFVTDNQFQLNQLTQVRCSETNCLCDDEPPIKSEYQRFHTIISNPPFHGTGRELDITITERLIAQSTSYLSNQGELWIVANHFLPYFSMIKDRFGYSEMVEEGKRFCVYLGRKT